MTNLRRDCRQAVDNFATNLKSVHFATMGKLCAFSHILALIVFLSKISKCVALITEGNNNEEKRFVRGGL